MVLVEGESGDGVTVDEDKFDVAADAPTDTAADRVVSAILGTREGAAEGGYQLTSTGVTWTDPIEAAALRDALAAHKVENVMLVSAFLAAAALAHSVGNETNYAHTALLYIEPDAATLAVVNSADGSIADIRRQPLSADDDTAVAELATMVSSAESLETHPDAVFIVGSGIDIPLIKPALEAATTLPLAAPEEPETALARGAALASAHAPLFVSSTAAQAWAQDPGTGEMTPFALAPGYFQSPADLASGQIPLAYSAVPEDLYTGEQAGVGLVDVPERRSFALVGSVVAAIFIVGVAALVVAMAVSIRPTAGVKPDPGQNVVAPPTQPVPAAAPTVPQAPAAVPQAPAAVPQAPAAVPQVPAPVPQVPAAVPAPVPQLPAPVPAPVPEVPAPVPVGPIPVPILVPGIPPIFGGPPGGGGPRGGGFPGEGGRGGGEGGHGGGGFPGFPGGGGFGGGHGGGFGGGHGGGRGH